MCSFVGPAECNIMDIDIMMVKAFVLRILVVLICFVSGCASKSAKLPRYMQPESLYLCGEPYNRLYVEVDSIEGVEVPDEALYELKQFLSEHCSKPDGIKIVRDKPIPVSEIKDLSIGPASILCIDGPDSNSEPEPAYLHVFVYDTDIVFEQGSKRPFVPGSCPSTIFFNVDYASRWAGFIIRHEAGHVSGLCKNIEHGDGVHCKNSGCLMNDTPDLLSQLGALVVRPSVGRLCNDCRKDLRAWKSVEADPNLAFEGPFLVRREEGYSVASLPYCNFLMWSSIKENFDWQEALEKIKDNIKGEDFKQAYMGHKEPGWMLGTFSPDTEEESSQSMVETLGVLTSAADDPDPYISRYALVQLEQLRQEQSN